MTREIARRRSLSPRLGLAAAACLFASGCATVIEVPVETPLQSKIDVSRFRRVLVAGFATDLEEADVELGSETTRLIQNQLRSRFAGKPARRGNNRIQISNAIPRIHIAPSAPLGCRLHSFHRKRAGANVGGT
jgi:hypothetical protein